VLDSVSVANGSAAMWTSRAAEAAFAGLLTILIAAASGSASAQTIPPAHPPATVPSEAERDSLRFVIRPDDRHGPSHFARVRHPEVQYEAGATLSFDRYHTVDVMYEWLRRWAERHPNLVELYQVGTSFEGRPIMQITVTNQQTGPATEKPAAYFEGGRHSGEITSSESVLWLAQHLIEGYGRDAEITRLLDRAAIFLRPQNNPDGSNLYLHTAQANRSSLRPIDNDGDGLADEDPANDLDGDGVVLRMRWRDPAGEWTIDPRDPQGRLMIRAEDGNGEWSMGGEGLDDDGDGRTDEDGVGGLDLHRNYPENWRPDSGRDRTSRGYTQFGSGAFPLSEPETRATALFVLENPNIGVVNSMDTRVPMHLRPPSTSHSADRMYAEDLAFYEHFDSVGLSITGYPWAGDVYHEYATRGNPDRDDGNPLFGHGPDFGYFYFGAIWYGDELWDGGVVGDVNGDGEEDELDRLIWQDSVTNGRAFKKWTKFDHPEHGEVEVGGWHPKFFSQNGPPEVLSKWAGNQARFNLYLAKSLPELTAGEPRVRRTGSNADSTSWEVRIPVTNKGRLPTALKQADLVKIVRPDRVVIELDGVRTAGQDRQARIVTTGRGAGEIGYIQPGETKEAVFTVRLYDGTAGARGTFEVLSTRGGVVRGTFTIGSPAG